MKEIVSKLRVIYFLALGSLLAEAALVEFVLLDTEGGLLVGNGQQEFIAECIAVALTLGGSYLALRMFRFKYVTDKLREDPQSRYLPASLLRMLLLYVPMDINILCYQLFVNASFGWMGAMLLLCWPFIYPTEDRYINETQTNPENPAS